MTRADSTGNLPRRGRLTKLKVAAVAIERPDGPLVEAMLDTGLKIVVVAPRRVKALRSHASPWKVPERATGILKAMYLVRTWA
jgi:hypothetical protein